MTTVLQQRVVLCVDDEVPVLSAIRRLLRHEPYEILTAQTPQQALDWIEKRKVDLVISDQRMSDMRGSDLLKRVREISPSTARILLTGFPDLPSVLERVTEGVQCLITKPWRDADLKEAIRRVLERAAEEESSPTVVYPAPARAVERVPRNPHFSETVLRIDCAGRAGTEILAELGACLDGDHPQAILVAHLREIEESPMPFLRKLAEMLSGTETLTALFEDSGCAGVLTDFLGPSSFLEVFSPCAPESGRRVLLVGDSQSAFDVLGEAVRFAGHACEVARTTSAAAGAVDSARFDAVVLDLDLVEPDAVLVLDRLRRRGSAARLVALCTRAELWNDPTLHSLGPWTLVEKPYRLAGILHAIQGEGGSKS